MRGQVTEAIQIKCSRLLKHNIRTEELRLMPYVQYVLVNEGIIEQSRINNIEYSILYQWENKGWLKFEDNGKISVKKYFWDAMCELVWMGYVKI